MTFKGYLLSTVSHGVISRMLTPINHPSFVNIMTKAGQPFFGRSWK